MELRRLDGFEWTLGENFRKVAEVSNHGLSIDMASDDYLTVEQAKPLFGEFGLANILVAFPTTIESLNLVFYMANELDSRLVAINAKYFPFRLWVESA